MKKIVLSILGCLFLVTCGEKEKTVKQKTSGSASDIEVVEEKSRVVEKIAQDIVLGDGLKIEELNGNIDLNQDISGLTLSEVRILRNSFAAKQGYCFMKADLRGIFSTTTWYDKKMEDRFWEEESGNSIKPISYTKEQLLFIDRLKKREEELKKQNFINNRPNLDNIINKFQLEEDVPELMNALQKNGFAIVPNDNIQLFHVYEQNDYHQFPNFVTTDMYLQLFHMYFGYLLRKIEQEKFVPTLATICQEMVKEMKNLSQKTSNPRIEEVAFYNWTYYAIAYTALTSKSIELPLGYEHHYRNELRFIEDNTDRPSDFLEYKQVKFPYSLFKPRGHYTRTEKLKKYFKAMMWLQTAPFCLDNDRHLKRAIMSASVLQNNEAVLSGYKSIMEPINFIIGQPDNVSFLDIAQLLKGGHNTIKDLMINDLVLSKMRSKIKKIADQKNIIKPKKQMSCVDKMNFIPQRYLFDNEVLQEFVDVDSKPTKRGYPKGLDVMAVFGSESAEDILINELKEGEKWIKYPDILESLKNKTKTLDWNETIYNKWMYSLMALQKKNNDYPYFMQSTQWDKKNLNACLSSWAELKHDSILYAEQPSGAECGGGGPPSPYTVGYVEPNIQYWKAAIELIDLTKEILMKHKLLDADISGITNSVRENAEFLLSASQKELIGVKLSEKEYSQIETIGSTFEWLTLSLVKNNDEYIHGWHAVNGPDKSVAVVADVYTANAGNNSKPGILHVATGNVNDIYVLVEIEGYLYLTKGAVFGYHEFHLPMGNRLTDEEWQEMLERKEAPEMPDWIKEIMVPIDLPKVNKRIFYSSGC